MEKGYNRINWENNITPLSAENLNKMDKAIYDLYDNMDAWTELRNKLPGWERNVSSVTSESEDHSRRIASIESKLLTTSFDSTTGTLRIMLKKS